MEQQLSQPNMQPNLQKDLEHTSTPPSSGGPSGSKVKWLIPVMAAIIVVAVVFALIKMRSAENEPVPAQSVQQEVATNQGSSIEKVPATEPSRMYIDPPLVEQQVGDSFDVVIRIDTLGNNTVVANAVLKWNPEILEMTGSNTAVSAYPLQAISEQEAGSFAMARGVPGDGDQNDSDDGFTGDAEFMTITFTAKQTGSTMIDFDTEESAVVLDDGKGTRTVVDFAGAEVFVN